ncbi:MAG: hypothetical protein WCE62_06715, partial [Polyangiales bacterium]
MRIPRLLTILGPASVLYVLAARVSSNTASSPEWLVVLLSCMLSLAPFALLGAKPRTRGASGLALTGVAFGVAIASARTGSAIFDRTHDLAWFIAALVLLDLAFPKGTRALVRYGISCGFAATALTGAGLAQEGVVSAMTFGVVVLAGLLAAGMLHQFVLAEKGHVVEGFLAGAALVTLAVGLSYAWFGPFTDSFATTLEFVVAALLWLGHLAWVDPRWRSLRQFGVPVVAACAVCSAAAFAFVPDARLERWQVALLALISGIL